MGSISSLRAVIKQHRRCRRLAAMFVLIAAGGCGAAHDPVASNAATRSLGTLSGKIVAGGGPAPLPGAPSLAGSVTVFTSAGRAVGHQDIRPAGTFRFKLAPGRYLVTAGTQLHVINGCRPKTVRVAARRITRVNVERNCNVP